MIDKKTRDDLLARLPFLEDADSGFREAFFSAAVRVSLPGGETIAGDGSDCTSLALVLDGQVRVYKLSETGREVTLYRITSGDSCVLTASCIMSDRKFPAMAVTESPVEALLVPAPAVRRWLTESPAWTAFVFGLVSRRLADVISVLEDIVFHHLDERVAAYLVSRAANSNLLSVTHQQIASDLGTTREVVSRILKEFERRKLVRGARGQLLITDLTGLGALRDTTLHR